jgi:hypothetical protein
VNDIRQMTADKTRRARNQCPQNESLISSFAGIIPDLV